MKARGLGSGRRTEDGGPALRAWQRRAPARCEHTPPPCTLTRLFSSGNVLAPQLEPALAPGVCAQLLLLLVMAVPLEH